eukprot:gene6391-17798_t
MASTITATPTTTLATAATSAAAAKLQPLLLTTLPVSSSSNIHGALIINQTYIGGSCAVRDQLFTSCIAEHAPSGGVYGTATYLLDGLGAIRFQASVGNSNTNCDSVRGQVRLDGVTVDQQDIRSCMFYDVDIPVPPGTTTLTLATNQLGSTNTRDHLLWGDPRLIVTVTPIVTTTATSTTTLNATHSTTTTAATATTCTAEEGTQLSPIVAFSVAEGAVFSRNEDDGAHGNCLDADGAVKDEFKDGRTTWSKLRVDLTTLRINATDQTYATRVTGNRNLQLGYASNCGGSYSTLGEAMVDLRGTPFAITNVSADGNCDCPDSTGCTCSQWTAIGFNSAMKLVCTNNNQRCTVSCGGSSGSCSLAAGYLQLEYLAGYGIADVRRQCGILKPVPGQWILGGSNQNCVEVCAAQSWFSRCDLNVLTTFGAGSVPNPSWTDMCLDYGDGSSRLHPSLRVSDSKCYTNGEDDDARETCEHKDPNFRRDVACTASIAIPADGGWPDAASTCPSTGCALCSGWDAVFGTVATKGCHLALSGGSWRPGRVSSGTESYFPVGEVWMEIRFASDPGIACVKASGMGKGSGDGNRWNGGLTVQTSVDGVTYVTRERDEGAASTYNLDANYFPVLPPPPKLLISTSTVASTTTTEGGARSTKGRATSVGVNSNASEAAAEVSPKSDDEVTSTRKPSSTGTIVGVVVSLAVVAAVVGGLFMMRKKEQSRQRALTRGGGANRQQRQGRNEQVYTNAAFDGGNESGNDSEDYLEPVSTGAGNREYEPPPGLPAPAGSGYYSEIGTLRNSDTYAKPNEGAAEYAANGSGSGVVYATYAGSQGAEEAHYDMAQDEYAALEGGKSVYSSSA